MDLTAAPRRSAIGCSSWSTRTRSSYPTSENDTDPGSRGTARAAGAPAGWCPPPTGSPAARRPRAARPPAAENQSPSRAPRPRGRAGCARSRAQSSAPRCARARPAGSPGARRGRRAAAPAGGRAQCSQNSRCAACACAGRSARRPPAGGCRTRRPRFEYRAAAACPRPSGGCPDCHARAAYSRFPPPVC